MEQIHITAELRHQKGKGPARRLRAKGMVPAILYGPKKESVPLSIPFSELMKILKTKLGENVLIDLEIQGYDRSLKKTVMLKEYQIHPIKKTIEHADLYEITMDEKIRVSVPVQMVGTSAGVEKGGTLTQTLRELEIECLPSIIPESIEVDVSKLDLGDSIHVNSLNLGKDITILTDQQSALFTIIAPITEEKAPEEEIPEEEE